jgi:hypothetical protein
MPFHGSSHRSCSNHGQRLGYAESRSIRKMFPRFYLKWIRVQIFFFTFPMSSVLLYIQLDRNFFLLYELHHQWN